MLEKSIKNGREWRKPFRGSKAFDGTCRNGSCPACRMRQIYKNQKREIYSDKELKEFYG